MGLQEMKSEKVQSERAGEEAEGEEAKQLRAGQETSQGQWCCRNLRLGNAIGVSDAFYGFVLVHSLQSPSQDLFHHFPRSASRLKHSYMTKMQHVSGVLTTLLLLHRCSFFPSFSSVLQVREPGASPFLVPSPFMCISARCAWVSELSQGQYHSISHHGFPEGPKGAAVSIMAHTLLLMRWSPGGSSPCSISCTFCTFS